jgi:hypothetical protein
MPTTRPCSNIERRFPTVASQSRSRSTDWPDAQMLMTGRWSTRRPVISRGIFSRSNGDRMRPLRVIGHTPTSDQHRPSPWADVTSIGRWRNVLGRLRPLPRNRAPDAPVYRGQRPLAQLACTSTWTDQTRSCPRGQRLVISSDLFRLRFFVESCRSLHFSFPLKTLPNVSATLCIILCTCVSILSQIFLRVMLALHWILMHMHVSHHPVALK